MSNEETLRGISGQKTSHQHDVCNYNTCHKTIISRCRAEMSRAEYFYSRPCMYVCCPLIVSRKSHVPQQTSCFCCHFQTGTFMELDYCYNNFSSKNSTHFVPFFCLSKLQQPTYSSRRTTSLSFGSIAFACSRPQKSEHTTNNYERVCLSS